MVLLSDTRIWTISLSHRFSGPGGETSESVSSMPVSRLVPYEAAAGNTKTNTATGCFSVVIVCVGTDEGLPKIQQRTGNCRRFFHRLPTPQISDFSSPLFIMDPLKQSIMISQFQMVTGSGYEEATKSLKTTNWQLEVRGSFSPDILSKNSKVFSLPECTQYVFSRTNDAWFGSQAADGSRKSPVWSS
jgi:UBA-like domain